MKTQHTFKISGIGCALVDYLYQPVAFDGPIFSSYKSAEKGDGGLEPGILVFKDEFEKFCQEDYFKVRTALTHDRPPVNVNIGGPGIVALIHASQMLEDTSAEVRFYGAKGLDKGAEFIENGIAKTPLKLGNYKVTPHFTPFTDVLSDPDYDEGNGERIFINNIGAAWDFYPQDLDEDFFKSDVVVFGATALVPRIHENIGDLLQKAKHEGALTVVTTVYDFLNEKKDADNPWPLGKSVESYRYVDVLVVDKVEALRMSGCETVEEAFDFFKKAGVGVVIVTHGAKLTYYYAQKKGFLPAEGAVPVSARVREQLTAHPETAGDTTGCGDNFAGGVIASIARQMMEKPGQDIDIEDAVAYGTASGGFACFYHGGTWYESRQGEKKEQIDSFYQSYLEQLKKTDLK